jgi:Spy/CpxP family protein refolding chaperone
MRARASSIALLLVLGFQTGARADADPQRDPIRDRLFPPELVMQHQGELGIDERQRAALTKEMAAFQSQIVDLQWRLSSAVEELARLLDEPRIDEGRALAQADRVMALEHDVKKTHLGLLIRIRNLLTDAQRAELAKLRARG